MKNKLAISLILGICLLASFAYAEITWSEGTIVDFRVTDSGASCINDGTTWSEWISGELKERDSRDNCYRLEGFPSYYCCPEENRCVDISSGSGTPDYQCVGSPAPDFCSGYDNQQDCEGFNFAVANRSVARYTGINNICDGTYQESSVIGGQTCYRFTFDCRCRWNTATSNCTADVSRSIWTCPGNPSIVTEGNCTFAEINKKDDCDNSGFILYSWSADWEDGASEKPDWCIGGNKEFKCATKLAFFTITNLIIAAAILIIIYLVLVYKRNKKAGKKQKKR